jgi:hypothetical protein
MALARIAAYARVFHPAVPGASSVTRKLGYYSCHAAQRLPVMMQASDEERAHCPRGQAGGGDRHAIA